MLAMPVFSRRRRKKAAEALGRGSGIAYRAPKRGRLIVFELGHQAASSGGTGSSRVGRRQQLRLQQAVAALGP